MSNGPQILKTDYYSVIGLPPSVILWLAGKLHHDVFSSRKPGKSGKLGKPGNWEVFWPGKPGK